MQEAAAATAITENKTSISISFEVCTGKVKFLTDKRPAALDTAANPTRVVNACLLHHRLIL
jgi:hypothetical protein